MKITPAIAIITGATIGRLLLSFVIFPNNDASDTHNHNPLRSLLGPGILPAIGAAIVDPIHTWDHLKEACFWLRNKNGHAVPSLSGDDAGFYSAVYALGTRVVAPPLVVATLGETFVCHPGGGDNVLTNFLFEVIPKLLLLLSDAIGAYCIYCLGKRILKMESGSNEHEMEWHTMQRQEEQDKGIKSMDDDDDDLVIPGIVRPQRGWIFGLPSIIEAVPPEINEEGLTNAAANKNNDGAMIANGNTQQPTQEGKNGNHDHRKKATTPSINDTTKAKESSPLIDDNKQRSPQPPILPMDQLPLLVALSYYCNPISMTANSIGSLRSLWDALLLLSLYYATLPPTRRTKVEGILTKVPSATQTSFCLACATYADVGYAVFVLPILIWRGMTPFLFHPSSTPCSSSSSSDQTPSAKHAKIRIGQQQSQQQHEDWMHVLLLYLVSLGGLHFLASTLVGGEDWCCYRDIMVRTILPNVAFVQQDDSGSVPGPSMGLHWYMFVQMFDRFRPYFTVFVSGIPSMFVVPLMIRLHRYPSVLVATFQLLWAIFRPTTTVHTLTLGLHLALLNPRSIVRMRNGALISFFALPVPILLFVTFHRMWLVTGNGNPNYIYFQCFAYGMFVNIIAMEFVSATVKRDKVRRMMENGTMKKLLAKKKEEMEGMDTKGIIEKEDGENENGGSQKKDTDKVEESNGNVDDEKATNGNGNNSDLADDADSIDDDSSKPEPVVVFL